MGVTPRWPFTRQSHQIDAEVKTMVKLHESRLAMTHVGTSVGFDAAAILKHSLVACVRCARPTDRYQVIQGQPRESSSQSKGC